MKYSKLLAKYLTQRSDNNMQVAVAVIAGMAAGAAISILFAPAKGSDTRRMISDKTGDLGNQLKNSYTNLKDRVVGATRDAGTEGPMMARRTPQREKPMPKNSIKEASKGAHTEQSIS